MEAGSWKEPMTVSRHEAALRKSLAELDVNQRAAIKSGLSGGNCIWISGAGGGKTKVATTFVGVLCHKGQAPDRIIVNTFTRKAANELANRIEPLVAPHLFDHLRIGTTHSLALRKLRSIDRSRWPMQRCLDLPGRADGLPGAGWLWHMCVGFGKIKGTDLDGLAVSGRIIGCSSRVFMRAAELLRADGWSPPRDGQPPKKDLLHVVKENLEAQVYLNFLAAWRLYEEAKAQLAGWDFADCLEAYHRGLEDGTVADSADFVIVDEAQDYTKVQIETAKLLAKNGDGRIVFVGDNRQCIFQFRGAYPEAFQNAEAELAAARTDLPTNYRSGFGIVHLGNRVAHAQPWAMGAVSVPARTDPGEVKLWLVGETPEDEADLVAQNIAADIREGADPNDYAVLCRTNAMVGLFEAALVSRKIPVAVVGGQPFFAQKEVKDFLAYAALARRDGYKALTKIRNKPSRFLGSAFDREVASARVRMGKSAGLTLVIRAAAPALRGGSRRSATELADTIDKLRGLPWALGYAERGASGEPATDVPQAIIEILKPMYVDDKGEADEDREAVLAAVAAVTRRFTDPVQLIDFAKVCLGQVARVSEDSDIPKGRVTLSTAHRSKGREFRIVVVPMARGLFPHARAEGPRQQAEELRLAYVAWTRAKDALWLTCSERNAKGGPAGWSDYIYEFLGDKEAWILPPEGVPLTIRPAGEAGPGWIEAVEDGGLATNNDCNADNDCDEAPETLRITTNKLVVDDVSPDCDDADDDGDEHGNQDQGDRPHSVRKDDASTQDREAAGSRRVQGDAGHARHEDESRAGREPGGAQARTGPGSSMDPARPDWILTGPLDPPLSSAFVVVDTETTGLFDKPAGWVPRIIELGAVVVLPDGSFGPSFEALVNPGADHLDQPAAQEAQRFNGILRADIEAEGFDTADAAQLFTEWLAAMEQAHKITHLRAFNQAYDGRLLSMHPWTLTLPWGECIMEEALELMKTHEVAKWRGPKIGFKWPKAEEAAQFLARLGVEGLDTAQATIHRALADAANEARIAVALALVKYRDAVDDGAACDVDTADGAWDGAVALAKRRTDAEPHAEGTGPGSRAVAVQASAFTELLEPLGFRELRGGRAGQRCWASETKAKWGIVGAYVYSSIVWGDAAQPVGEDSIKVSVLWLGTPVGGKPPRRRPMTPKLARVFRTRGWRTALLERIQEAMAYVRLEPGCPQCGAPMRVQAGGRNGFFLSCCRYPDCKGSRNITEE